MSKKQQQMICVYCGSSQNVDDKYKELAVETGRTLAENDYGVVYGGGRVGLMGLVADTALERNTQVVGIIPGHIDDREVRHEDLSELHVVDTMHERKQMMAERADAFVILPGGLGTMDEFFEITTWKQLGLHDKPIIIVNTFGYWDHLIALVENIMQEGFMRPGDRSLFTVVEEVGEILPAIEEAPHSVLETRKDKI